MVEARGTEPGDFTQFSSEEFQTLLGVIVEETETIPKGELLQVPGRFWEIHWAWRFGTEGFRRQERVLLGTALCVTKPRMTGWGEAFGDTEALRTSQLHSDGPTSAPNWSQGPDLGTPCWLVAGRGLLPWRHQNLRRGSPRTGRGEAAGGHQVRGQAPRSCGASMWLTVQATSCPAVNRAHSPRLRHP